MEKGGWGSRQISKPAATIATALFDRQVYCKQGRLLGGQQPVLLEGSQRLAEAPKPRQAAGIAALSIGIM